MFQIPHFGSLFIVSGKQQDVVPYLVEAEVASLAESLRSQANFRYWIVDYFSPKIMTYMYRGRRKKQMKNAPWVFNPADWFAFFAKCGWQQREIRYIAEESEKLGRPVPLPWIAKIFRFFLRSAGGEEFKRFSAYVLLEPK